MIRHALALALLLTFAGGCAATQPGPAAAASAGQRPPAKCGACHLPPQRNSLAPERWSRFLSAHQRRLHISDEEQALLHDYLVAPTPSGSHGEPGGS